MHLEGFIIRKLKKKFPATYIMCVTLQKRRASVEIIRSRYVHRLGCNLEIKYFVLECERKAIQLPFQQT